jgi:hypothetical protein
MRSPEAPIRESTPANRISAITRVCGQTEPARSYHEMETAMTDENLRDDDDLLLRLEAGDERALAR